MRFRSGMIFALGATLALSGCAAGAASGGGPATSPTGKVYPEGTPPSESRFTAPANLFLAQQQFQRALESAQQGIAADSTNPQHYFIAGQALVGLGRFDDAMEMFDRAQAIYPAYELEVEPAREQAWATAFNEGVEAYNAGDMDAAIAAWSRANAVYGLRPEGFLNLAVIYTQQNQYDQAIQAYRAGLRAIDSRPQTRELTPEELTEREESKGTMLENLAQLLTFTEQFAEAETLYRQQLAADPDDIELQSNLALSLARQGKEAEAQAIYSRLLSQPGLSGSDLFNIGVALFNAKSFDQAAEAFRRVTETMPNSRDAWYNYANALYAGNEFAALVPVAERLMTVDPLNENSALILARAYREAQQNPKALAALQANEEVPVHVEDLEMRPGASQTTVRGRVIGNKAAAGSPVRLRFTFYGPTGAEVGTQTVNVSAPAADASANFEVVLPQAASAYKYELVR